MVVGTPLVRGDCGGCVDIPLVRGDCGGCAVIPLSEEVIVGELALSYISLVRG